MPKVNKAGLKNYIRVSNFERRKRKTGNTFNSIPQIKYLLNWDSIYIIEGMIMKIKFNSMNFVWIVRTKYCPLEMIYQIYSLILFSNDMKKLVLLSQKILPFYVPQQLNNLWQWTLLTHSILYSVIWFVTRDRKLFWWEAHNRCA